MPEPIVEDEKKEISSPEELIRVLRQSQAHRRSQREETFTFTEGGWIYRWDISAAWRLIHDQPREPVVFYPAEQGVDLDHLLDRYHGLDLAYTLGTDISCPLLFVPMGETSQLIDGWHRLAHVLLEEQEEVQAYVLSQEEADSVLLFCMTAPPKETEEGDTGCR
jgi:hypothetical protein